jgi:uncharacterized membrane protein
MVAAAATHFVYPKVYGAFLPSWVPAKPEIVWVSGLAELLVGMALLYEPTAAYGAMVLLILMVAYLPLHLYQLFDPPIKLALPLWAFQVRAALQFALIYGAYLMVRL